MEGDQDPPLVMDVISRRPRGRTSDNLRQRLIYLHLFCPGQDLPIEVLGPRPYANGLGNGHGIKGIGLPADWVGMGKSRILLGPLGYLSKIIVSSEDPQWADPHQSPVCKWQPKNDPSRQPKIDPPLS